MAELCQVFLGDWGRRLYFLALSFYVVVSCQFYCVIFSLSMTAVAPLHINGVATASCDFAGGLDAVSAQCRTAYSLFLALFGVMMLAVVTRDPGDSKRLNQGLTIFGLAIVAVMTLTIAVALADEDHVAHSDDPRDYVQPLFNGAGFQKAFNTFTFAQFCQHGIPQVSSEERERERGSVSAGTTMDGVVSGASLRMAVDPAGKVLGALDARLLQRPAAVRGVFAGALGVTTAAYLVLGSACALYFGGFTQALVTLNWSDYTAGTRGGTALSHVVSYLVRLFPVITISAAFPLNVISLGDTLRALLAPAASARATTVACRWAACVPPLLGSALVCNVATLTNACGILAYALVFYFPGALQIVSRRRCREAWGSGGGSDGVLGRGAARDAGATPYSGAWSHELVAYGGFCFATAAIGYSFASMLHLV